MKVREQCCRCYVLPILLIGAVLFLFVLPASAQLSNGTFLGVVKDSSGAIVPGATVTIQSLETNQTRKATTDSSGSYRVPALPVGHYDIRVEHQGFKTETRPNLNLEVGQEAVVDFALQVGTAEQTVQVTGEAQQVNTTNSTLGSVVSEQTISDLPLNGRNYTDLTLLQPGITQHKGLNNAGGNQPGTVFSSNGGTIQSNSFTLDGASLVNTYSVSAASGTGNALGVDGIREYKVVTNNFGAEYGMTMGSQTVLVSKSGTNSFHGDAFEFFRNSALDAANYFDAATSANNFQRTPPFKRNNFGGAVGGPVQKDKTFFFVAYEGLRESIGQTIVTATAPAACLPPLGTQVKNPCNTLSSSPVSNAAWTVAKLLPVPNLPNDFYTYPFNEPITENWGQGRLDHTFSASDNFFGRYTFDDSFYKYGLEFQPFTTQQATRGQFATLGENHVFTPALLNSFRFSFSRTASTMSSPSDFGPGFPSFVPDFQVPGFGTFQISGTTASTATGAGAGLGPTATQPNFPRQNIFTYSDDLFYEKGKHSLKFGVLINHYQIQYLDYTNSRGNFTVNNLASLFAGTMNSAAIIYYSNPVRHYRFDTIGFYAQDDFKVRSNLTLNLGLRYEFATVINDRDGMNQHTDLSCNYPCFPVGVNYKNPYLHNFSPRIGFAWDVLGNGKMSLRGGAALLYDVATLGSFIQGLIQTEPFSEDIALGTTPIEIPLSLAAEKNTIVNHTGGGIAYNIKAPKMYQWNLTGERQFPFNTALQVSYVGSRGIHIFIGGDGNPVVFSIQNGQPFWPAVASSTFTPHRLINDTWSTGPYGGGGNTYYHALEVSVTKRASHGLQFQSEYTYSKLIDNVDGNAPSQSGSTSNLPVSILDLGIDRSLASYDARHNYRFNTIYNLPTTNASNSFVRGALNGWWTAAIVGAQSGYPFTPSISSNRSRSGGGTNPANLDRPDWLPGRNPYNATHGGSSGCTLGSGASTTVIPPGTHLGGPSLYFDPCAFTLEPVGFEGNVGRNSVIGPGLLDVDFSLVKDTSVKWLGEAGKVEFRAEFFNILNHPNFAQPSRNVFSGTSTVACPITGCPTTIENPSKNAGVITSTATGTTATQSSGNSRQIQFGLKIVF